MKRIVWLLSCLLVLCLAVPAMAAMTQDEWNLSCTKKTSMEATLYDYSGDKPGAELGTLPQGTYVKVDGAKSDHWMGLIYLKNGEETKGWAQVTLEDCVSKIKKSDGKLYDVHEKDPEYDKKIAEGTLVFDVKIYSDYAAYLSYSIGLGPEPPRKDGLVSAPKDDEAAADDNANDEFAVDDTAVDDTKAKDTKDAKAKDTKTDDGNADDGNADDASADTTDDTADVELTGDEAITELGVYQSKVKVGKKEQTVLTSTLTLGTDVPADQQLAVIHTPRTGNATLRKKAATDGGTVKKLEAGTVVVVLEVGDEYTKVRDGKKEGYVINKCLKFYAPATTTEGTAQLSKNGKADGKASINIRSEADKDSAKVDTWKTGTEVVIFSHADGWYEVEANGKHGFVMEQFITMPE